MGVFGVLLSPLIYSFGLTSYQKGRIISWFSSDQTLSEKWNILQSEISIEESRLGGFWMISKSSNVKIKVKGDKNVKIYIWRSENASFGDIDFSFYFDATKNNYGPL